MRLQGFLASRYWWLFAGLLLLLAAGWTWSSRIPDFVYAERLPSPHEGFPAPDFTVNTLTGEQVSLATLRGKVVIVNLWASWCVPCRAEMPALQRLFESNRDRGLEVVAVNSTIQDSPDAAQVFVAEIGVTFKVGLDEDGSVSRRYLLKALPSTFIIDRQGIIRIVLVGGPVSEAVLQSKIEDLLNARP